MPENFKGHMPQKPEVPENDSQKEKMDKTDLTGAMLLQKDSHSGKENSRLNLNEVIDSVYLEMAKLETSPSAEEIETAMRQLIDERYAGRYTALLTKADFIRGTKIINSRLYHLHKDKERQGGDTQQKKEFKINPHKLGEAVNWVTDQILENLETPPTLGEIKAQLQELVRQGGADTITAADINVMAGKIAAELWRKKRWQVNKGK